MSASSPSISWEPGMFKASLSATGAQWLQEALCTHIWFSLCNAWTLSLILLGIQEILVNNAQGILEFAKIDDYTLDLKESPLWKENKISCPHHHATPSPARQKTTCYRALRLSALGLGKTRNLCSYDGRFYEFLNIVTQCSLTSD